MLGPPPNGRNEPIPSRAWLESGNLFQQRIAFYFTSPLRNEAVSVNKDVLVFSDWSPLREFLSPKGTQEVGQQPPNSQQPADDCRLPEDEPKAAEDVKIIGHWP